MCLLKLGLILILLQYSNAKHTFEEELLVENFPDSHAHLHFQFISTWNINDESQHSSVKNYDLFPKRLGDIVEKFNIDELKLTLSQGTWKYDKWGMPSVSAPSGSELRSVFQKELSQELVDEYWLQSSRTISGLFGLSINLVDTPNTVKPKHFQISQNLTSKFNSDNLRYVSIPNEIVCTENLTPWLKLLPCGRNKGLAQLFKNIPKIFDSQYLLVGLNFKQKCLDPSCSIKQAELKQTLSLVYDLDLIKSKRTENEIVWSFENIFSTKLTSVCPVSHSTNVYFDLGDSIAPTIAYTKKVKYSNEKNIYVNDIEKIFTESSSEFNPLIISKRKSFSQLKSQLVYTHRYITNSNERNFGIKTIITNKSGQKLSITYFDTVPWYFRVYINSLEIKKNDNSFIKPDKIHFSPGRDRKQPNHLELAIVLEPKATYSIYFNAEYAYLKWDEYPPDVNHGFYINPAVISILIPDTKIFQLRSFDSYSSLKEVLFSELIGNNQFESVYNIYTETLLMNLPVPDFSMPYNVICLTCTVIAIAFGSLHNFTTRKFVFIESKSLKQKILEFLAKLKSKIG